MAQFRHTINTVSDVFPHVRSAPLGASANQGFSEKDIGKAIKLTPVTNAAGSVCLHAVLCSDNDAMDGVISSVSPQEYVNGGYPVGGVQLGGVVEAFSAATLARGSFVQAAAQVAIGTAGIAVIEAETVPATVAALADIGGRRWKVLEVVGAATNNGVSGTKYLIHKVG